MFKAKEFLKKNPNASKEELQNQVKKLAQELTGSLD